MRLERALRMGLGILLGGLWVVSEGSCLGELFVCRHLSYNYGKNKNKGIQFVALE